MARQVTSAEKSSDLETLDLKNGERKESNVPKSNILQQNLLSDSTNEQCQMLLLPKNHDKVNYQAISCKEGGDVICKTIPLVHLNESIQQDIQSNADRKKTRRKGNSSLSSDMKRSNVLEETRLKNEVVFAMPQKSDGTGYIHKHVYPMKKKSKIVFKSAKSRVMYETNL